MKQQNESVKKLEIGRDYISKDGLIVVIDRKGNYDNNGFVDGCFKKNIFCFIPNEWREATEEEVIEAFEKHLVHRYGEDWETMKIKEKHPDSTLTINAGMWGIEIVKASEGWNVWNKNGLLYCNGIWVERLEEEEINIKASEKLPINKVTTKILDIALRMVGIQLDVNTIGKVIDLVELIENKGDGVAIKDIVSLQQTW